MEEWKSIGFENLEINRKGDVKNPKTGTIRKPLIINNRKVFVVEHRKRRMMLSVHKLVIDLFGNYDTSNFRNPQIVFLDGDTMNTDVSNLIYVDGARKRTRFSGKDVKSNEKLTEADERFIIALIDSYPEKSAEELKSLVTYKSYGPMYTETEIQAVMNDLA